MPPRSDAHLDDPVLLGFPLKSGFRIVPPTIIIEQLGEGASAIVYRARHYNLDTDVAVKILRKDVAANNPDLVARFQREAKLAAQIRQENLLAVLDTTDHNGTHYTIMELVDGESVEGRVMRRGPLTVAEALTVTLATARGLAALHGKKVVHRDIKPSNIILSREGATKLADLGIAKQNEQFDTLATHANAILGTPQYMSPELFENAANAGERSDVYALGLTLAYMLSGEHQHMGKSLPEIIRAVCDGDAFDLSKLNVAVSDDLCAIVNRMTAQRVDERPDSKELLALLPPILHDAGGMADLADPAANSAFGTNDIPSRLDRDRISQIRAAMSTTGFGSTPIPATAMDAGQQAGGQGGYPGTAVEGGYMPTIAESRPIDTGAVRIPNDLRMGALPPSSPGPAPTKGGGGKWFAIAIILLLFLGIAAVGALLGTGLLVEGNYLAYTPFAETDDDDDPKPREQDEAEDDKPDDGGVPSNARGAVDPPADENEPPVVSGLTDQTVVAGQSLGPVRFTVSDDSTPVRDIDTTVTSSNPARLPSDMIALAGSGRSSRLSIDTIAGQTGSVRITVTATDAEGLTGEQTFNLDITEPERAPMNTPPTLSNLRDLTIAVGERSKSVTIDVDDKETPPDELQVSARSNMPAVLPVEALDVSRRGARRTLTITPVGDQNATAQITVIVMDSDGARTEGSFTLTLERTVPMTDSLDEARLAANRRDWTRMFDALATALEQAKRTGQIDAFASAAGPMLGQFRRGVADWSRRQGTVPNLRDRLAVLAEQGKSSVAAILMIETLIEYEQSPELHWVLGRRGTEAELRRALQFAELAVALPDPQYDACVYAADIQTQPKAGVNGAARALANGDDAARWLEIGMQQDHPGSYARRGIFAVRLAIAAKDSAERTKYFREAEFYLQRGAELGSIVAQYEYGVVLNNRGATDEANVQFVQAARGGHVKAREVCRARGLRF